MSLPPPLITRNRPTVSAPYNPGGNQSRKSLQIPAARYDLSEYDGECVFDGAFKALYHVGKFDEGVYE